MVVVFGCRFRVQGWGFGFRVNRARFRVQASC